MEKLKVLVTGAAGLVGSQIIKDLTTQNHEIISCYHNTEPECGTPTKLDLTNPDNIRQVIIDSKPDSVIHLAALTGVDECETKKELATQINAKATEILAKQTAKIGSFFLYVSTDYVFDGIEGMKKEDDTPNPINHYGKSKQDGEHSLNKLASPYAIARTSTPFGFHKTKKSFPLWVKQNLESHKSIPVLVNQFTSPTYVPNLSKMLIEIATRQLVGIIHTAGATKISRYTLAEIVADKLNLDKKYLQPTSLDDIQWKAKRPSDSSLDVSWASEILNEKPQKIQQSIDMLFSKL